MPTSNADYGFINNKIRTMKDGYPSLRSKQDNYVFSALSVKSHLYKNPALLLDDNDFEDMIVDGQYDGGVDVLLTDPSSESSDLVIVQSKYQSKISFDEVHDAMTKMALFYKDMTQGHYEQVNPKVQRRFLSLFSELGDESKIHFVFYTSAPQKRIDKDRVENKFRELFSDSGQFEVSFFFGADIVAAIKESESLRATVERGKIKIDDTDNYLLYGDNAAIVNVSAFSIKELYAQYNIQLLARNLRYHIAGRDIDKGIEETIRDCPESFWLKNNGITIVCSDFAIDGREVKLKDFSIINGGQTTYMIHKNRSIDESHDIFLPCKIIRAEGKTEDQKNAFCLAIAKAANTQKPIKQVDLKANSPEQVRFSRSMREVGIFYQTKRGEVVPPAFKTAYLNSSLVEIGKLCLAAIFQIPCASRSKPSSLYDPKYYDKIFNGNQMQIANLAKELLYIDYYFKNKFQKEFDTANTDMPDANDRISFAHNARTVCIAFVAFASRYHCDNIDNTNLAIVFEAAKFESTSDAQLYAVFSNIDGISHFFPQEIFNDKDKYDAILHKLFMVIINAGITSFSLASRYEAALNATNYLKKDKNYYAILKDHWASIKLEIQTIFDEMDC